MFAQENAKGLFGLRLRRAAASFCALLCFAVIGALLLPSNASANDVYISQSGGGAGSSCGNTLAASYFNTSGNWTGGTPTGTQIGPGTTVHLCGTFTGATNGTILTVQGNGTSGHPITLLFESGAQLTAPVCNWAGNNSACLVLSTPSNPHSYITVNGGTPCGWSWATGSEGTCNGSIVNTASGTASNQGTSTGGIEMQDCNTCTVENLGIYNLYVQSGGDTNANPQGENCITFSGPHIFIHDNAMHDVGWCLYYYFPNAGGDSDIEVYNNDVYNTPHPTNFAAGNTGVSAGAYWHDNHFHDFANWNTPSCTYHVEGFHSDGNGGTSSSGAVFNNLYMYNNLFGPNVGSCMFAAIYWSGNVNAPSAGLVNNSAAFNNVALIDDPNSGFATAITGNGNLMFNNTWINTAIGNNGEAFNFGSISAIPGYTYTVENNAVQGFWNDVANQDSPAHVYEGLTFDYNVYSQCPAGGAEEGNCLLSFGNPGSSWSGYISAAGAHGQEQHSRNTGLFGSGSCCTGNLGLNSSYVPASTGAPVVGVGANLSSVCTGLSIPGNPCLKDAGGNLRPATNPWDVGAFQFAGGSSTSSSSSTSTPAAPTGLTAIVN